MEGEQNLQQDDQSSFSEAEEFTPVPREPSGEEELSDESNGEEDAGEELEEVSGDEERQRAREFFDTFYNTKWDYKSKEGVKEFRAANRELLRLGSLYPEEWERVLEKFGLDVEGHREWKRFSDGQAKKSFESLLNTEWDYKSKEFRTVARRINLLIYRQPKEWEEVLTYYGIDAEKNLEFIKLMEELENYK